MSDRRILLCGPAIDLQESADRLGMLRQITLPDVTKFVVTTGKFDTQKAARAFNVEAHYPAEPARLQSLATMAEGSHVDDPRFRDAYDLFCLRRILQDHTGFEFAVLLRDAHGFDEQWGVLQSSIADRLFLTFQPRTDVSKSEASTSLLVDLRDKRAIEFLDRVAEVYGSGAAYSMSNYSLNALLGLCLDSLRHEQTLMQNREPAVRFSGTQTSGHSARSAAPPVFAR